MNNIIGRVPFRILVANLLSCETFIFTAQRNSKFKFRLFYFNTCTVHLLLFCIITNKFTINIIKVYITAWAGQLSRYSDWLRAGQSGDRIPVGATFSVPVQTGPGVHPASCTMGTGSFPGVKSGRGVTLTPHPILVPWSGKSRAIPLLPLMGRTACTEPQCLYKGSLYVYL